MAAKRKGPWLDRAKLIKRVEKFVKSHGYFFNQNAKRMSDLLELAVYNEIVRYYKKKGFTVAAQNTMRDGTFKYKLSPTALMKNYSYFTAVKTDKRKKKQKAVVIQIHHNTQVQSAHNDHTYFTADVAVCSGSGVSTRMQKNGRRHSFVRSKKLVSFFEAKHLTPFPEVLFSFSGLVLEMMPGFIDNTISTGKAKMHVAPTIIFSGDGSDHSERIAQDLTARYGFNIVTGLQHTNGRITSMDSLRKYDG